MAAKGLLCVSFGTSNAQTREKTIDAIERKLAESFPDRKFYSAWSSKVIKKKVLEERGEEHDGVEGALAKARADGIDDLAVVTTFLMHAHEMRSVQKALDQWKAQTDCKVSCADPLLAGEDDLRALVDAVCGEFSFLADDEVLLLMGHGSPRGDNSVYFKVQDLFHDRGRKTVFVATVEGEPTFQDVLPDLLASNARCVYLAPLMIVAGEHANNDLAGPGEGSWQSMLRRRGAQTQAVLKGLGEYPGVQELICEHARRAAEGARRVAE